MKRVALKKETGRKWLAAVVCLAAVPLLVEHDEIEEKNALECCVSGTEKKFAF